MTIFNNGKLRREIWWIRRLCNRRLLVKWFVIVCRFLGLVYRNKCKPNMIHARFNWGFHQLLLQQLKQWPWTIEWTSPFSSSEHNIANACFFFEYWLIRIEREYSHVGTHIELFLFCMVSFIRNCPTCQVMRMKCV